jgi:hypothetical protein
MKLFFLIQIPVIFFLFFRQDITVRSTHSFPLLKDTSVKSWIDDFKAFRNAVYTSDTAKLKSYFSFPITGNNDIWYLVLNQKELEAKNIDESTVFTEADFIKYYKKLFPKDFIMTLLKIKSADLQKRGKSESSAIKEGNTNIKMYATYSRKEKIVALNLSYNTPWKETDESIEGGESNYMYTFRILSNNRLQFVKLMIAG